METKRSFQGFMEQPSASIGADAPARPSAPTAKARGGKETSLTPDERRIANESLKRFDTLYRKLAE